MKKPIESSRSEGGENSEGKVVVDLSFQIEDDKILYRKKFDDGSEETEWHQEDTDPNRPDLIRERMKELHAEFGIEEKAE